jgi:hypothetical protein
MRYLAYWLISTLAGGVAVCGAAAAQEKAERSVEIRSADP